MRQKLVLALTVVLLFALTSCGGKTEAYEKFIGLADEGKIVEAYEYWTSEGEDTFGDSDYKEIANYREYVNAVGPYLAGEPVRLSTKISVLSDLPSDFLDTAKYLEEMDDLLDDMEAEYTDPTETYYDDVAKLKFDGEEFRFVMGSVGDSGVVNWAVKDGKITHGTGGGDRFEYTFTFTEKGVEVVADDDMAMYAGTYLK